MARSTILKRVAAVAAALTATVLLTGCTPDVTRGRVEYDIANTFSNQYEQSLQLQGLTADAPEVKSIECHSSVNMEVDSGPGGWPCEIKYTDANGDAQDDTFLVLIDSLGCYQAFNVDDKKRYRKITVVQNHEKVLDPAGSFDGCMNVYDDRTNTSKK